jgi:hypothetical protein
LAVVVVLPAPLQARHQDDGRGLGGQVDVRHPFAHGGGEFPVHQTHQGLTGGERAHHLGAQRLFLDAGDEVAHHGQRDVGLQQRHAHFAQHVLHIAFGDARLTAHGLDQAAETIGKGGSHRAVAPSFPEGRP